MFLTLIAGLTFLILPPSSSSQANTPETEAADPATAGSSHLPDAPLPPDAATAPWDAERSQRKRAQEQLKQQEHQRVMGVMATFNTTRNRNALPLDPKQKFELFFRSATDPWPFVLAGAVAGIGQADASESEWGQGAKGYAKRFGASYSDAFIGNFFGNAVLPVLLHEDPRYFQKSTGSGMKRFLWAAASTVWCKRDNGTWGPNYANVGGNMIGAAISRAYYPASETSVADVLNDGLTVSAEGIVGAEVIEFWPDMVRHYRRNHVEKIARRDAESAAPKKTEMDRGAPAPTQPPQP